MNRLTISTLFLSLLAPVAAAQDEPPMPKPTAEHEMLAKDAGTWDATIEAMGMDGKPQQSKGVSVRTMGPGGFWLLDDTKADMMGMPFTGHGVTGYDPAKKKFVATWVDSFAPSLLIMEGTYDSKTKALTMTGACDMGTMKTVTTHKDADTMVFEMFMVADGKDQKQMTITYKRRKGEGAPGR